MFTFKPAYCSSHIALLVREHFNLKSTIVTGIPMKVWSLSLMISFAAKCRKLLYYTEFGLEAFSSMLI